MIGIRLQNHKKMSITEGIEEYTSPSVVYIPLSNRGNNDVTLLVKKNDYVYKGQVLGKVKGNLAIPIRSSVSGIIKGFEFHETSYGMTKCVVIENDFENREEDLQIKTPTTKEEFIQYLYDFGIVGLGGSAFPTYEKFKQATKFKTFIVNGIEGEPYVTSDYMLMYTKMEEILECCDIIMDIFEIEECFIVIRVRNDALKEKIKSLLGTYPKIKLVEVPDLYPMGWEKYIVRYIKHLDYLQLPTEKEIIVNNVSTVYAIYEALLLKKPLLEKVVTFSGEEITTPKNIRLRIGTKLKDVLPTLSYRKCMLISGGPMMGKLCSEEMIITNETKAILFMKKIESYNMNKCIRCGKCVRVCPVKISPVLICDNIENKKLLTNLQAEKCVECGLCSYICPAKIQVRSYVKKAKQLLKEETHE